MSSSAGDDAEADADDANAATGTGWTALMVGADGGHVGVVETLVAKVGAEVNGANEEGLTAVMAAATKGRAGVVKAPPDLGRLCSASDQPAVDP